MKYKKQVYSFKELELTQGYEAIFSNQHGDKELTLIIDSIDLIQYHRPLNELLFVIEIPEFDKVRHSSLVRLICG